jgi:hypothetical protein
LQPSDKEAIDCLEHAVDPKIFQDVKPQLETDNCFTVIWVLFVKQLVSNSSAHFESVKKRIRECSASQHAGENVQTMGNGFFKNCEELAQGGCCDHDLTQDLLSAFINAGGEDADAESHWFELRAKVAPLCDALAHVKMLSEADANAHMGQHDLTHKKTLFMAQLRQSLVA